MANESKELGMASPATYQITFKGVLTGKWADWFNGTDLTIEHKVEGTPLSILICHVRDQAELFGILNHLNSLNLLLLQVNYISAKGEYHV